MPGGRSAWACESTVSQSRTLRTAVTSKHTWLGGVPGNPLNDAAVPHSDPVKGRSDGPFLQRQHERVSRAALHGTHTLCKRAGAVRLQVHIAMRACTEVAAITVTHLHPKRAAPSAHRTASRRHNAELQPWQISHRLKWHIESAAGSTRYLGCSAMVGEHTFKF